VIRRSASPLRCLAVWGAATTTAGLLAGWWLADLVAAASDPPPSTRVPDWLVLGCEAAALVAVAWLWVLVTLVALDATRAAAPRRGVPAGLRRVVLAACGAGLAGGLVSPAYAATPPSPLAGLPLPDRPTGHAVPHGAAPDRPAPTSGTDRRRGAPATVLVAPGDSLWALAEAELPGDASDAEVDRRWRTVHATNHAVIGDDPDLILPGQRLRLPPRPPQQPPAT